MLSVSSPLSKSARLGWLKFRIAEALGPGEHQIHVASPGPSVLVDVFGIDYDEEDRPTADIEAYHPDIEGWRQLYSCDHRLLKNCPASFVVFSPCPGDPL